MATVTKTRVFGKAGVGNHLEIFLREGEGSRASFARVQWWDGAARAERLAPGTLIDVVVEAGIQVFRGVAEAQLRVLDVRLAVAQPVGRELECAR